MKYAFKIVLLSAFIWLATSCEEDFLVVNDESSLTDEVFPANAEDMDLLLNSVYANTHSLGLYGMSFLMQTIYPLENTQNMGFRSDDGRNQLITKEANAENQYSGEAWRDTWRGIQQANTYLSNVEKIRTQLDGNPSATADFNQRVGEAYFLRAWHYFMVQTLFGETFIKDGVGGDQMGMPIVTNPALSFEDMRVQRSTVRETWDFIISDLMMAETLLSGINQEFRADEFATKAFLGRVYVFTEDYANASNYLLDVIENSGKSLMPFSDYEKMFYEDNFEGDNNSESLFEITLKAQPGNGWGSWGPSTGANAGMVNAPTYLTPQGGRTSTGWGNSFPSDENLTRFGFNLPAPTWVDNPEYDSSMDMSMTNFAEMPDPLFLEESRNLRETQLADPRLWVYARQVFEDSTGVDGSYFRIWPQHETPWAEIDGLQHAWSFNKFMNKTRSEYNDSVQNGSNIFWLRLADIYLLYAEALIASGGNQTIALEYINKVHRRAYGLPTDAASAIDYQSLSDNTLASDPILSNNPLRYERYVEFLGEGLWWWDICRWKIGPEEAAFHGTSSVGDIIWNEKDYALPIPNRELESNPEMKQNPGY